jgi:hypothetical protein
VKTSPLLGIAALLGALATTACTAGAASARPDIELSVHDGPIWMRPDDIERYVCTDGVFVCEDPIGRVSERRCRCVP